MKFTIFCEWALYPRNKVSSVFFLGVHARRETLDRVNVKFDINERSGKKTRFNWEMQNFSVHWEKMPEHLFVKYKVYR